ncbi:hypothetical protein [Mangrovibacterium marinum]|uniref:Uncharacterized protein n=1 Tax=Mangrovibacterium marinum TaxID=1639118 RepID=A0A2T5BYV9_9BACT|nr:hypothetical protein [Mangrovibacterium marinum]PTN07427.1 hypothetical protein C8N47_11720 [Mangrovibacterium marinum]
MEENNNLKKIQEAIDSLPENFSILEEQIDVELQVEYFEYTKDKNNNQPIDDFEAVEQQLYDSELSETLKKQLLVRLAGHDNVDAFRMIERFKNQAEGTLRNWAILALQESRMILQSSLLDEQQVFISTGLGGKGQNIRYFIALLNSQTDQEFTEPQKKMITDEFNYFLTNSEGELEKMEFSEGFATGLFLFPLKKNLQDIFKSFIDECNQYGNFLKEDVIITNVKQLTIDEIKEFLKQDNSTNKHDEQED